MEKNNSNGTVTFYPNNYENSEEDVHSLSTKGRLLSYNNQLKDSLHNGLKFTDMVLAKCIIHTKSVVMSNTK